jgi:hypothetical protein
VVLGPREAASGTNPTGAVDGVVQAYVERPHEAKEVESRRVWMTPVGPLVISG